MSQSKIGIIKNLFYLCFYEKCPSCNKYGYSPNTSWSTGECKRCDYTVEVEQEDVQDAS